MKLFLKPLVIAIFLSLFFGCTGSKSAMSPTGKISKYIEEFFVGNGVMQYFIQPLDYDGINQKNSTLDATLRNQDKTTDSLSVNFLVNLKSKDTVQRVSLTKPSGTYELKNVKTFYFEPFEEELYQHRVSVKMPYNIYADYLLDVNHSISVYNSTENVVITPAKNSKKAIEVLKEKLDRKLK